MIYGAGVDVIRFALNASINWTVTPDLLNKMKFVKSAHWCPLLPIVKIVNCAPKKVHVEA